MTRAEALATPAPRLLRRPGSRRLRSTRGFSSSAPSASTPSELVVTSGRAARARARPRSSAPCSSRRLAREPVARHPRRARVLGPALSLFRPTPSCPRPDTETVVETALRLLSGPRAPLRDPRSRHRLRLPARRPPARAAQAPSGSASTAPSAPSRRRAECRAQRRSADAPCSRQSDWAAALPRPLRPRRLEPALYRLAGHRHARSGGARARPAARPRRRRGRARRLPGHPGGCAAAARPGRPPRPRDRLRPGRGHAGSFGRTCPLNSSASTPISREIPGASP